MNLSDVKGIMTVFKDQLVEDIYAERQKGHFIPRIVAMGFAYIMMMLVIGQVMGYV